LLANQVDIGGAIKPFYGNTAGDQLTALLHDHITIAVELLQAAKAGDTPAFDAANTRWQANADAIADFLASANPRSWPRAMVRADMRVHLDQTLAEAAHELQGDYATSVTDYEAVHQHILAIADMLSAGIMRQFPARFR
jgi:prophage DNA circulation protein